MIGWPIRDGWISIRSWIFIRAMDLLVLIGRLLLNVRDLFTAHMILTLCNHWLASYMMCRRAAWSCCRRRILIPLTPFWVWYVYHEIFFEIFSLFSCDWSWGYFLYPRFNKNTRIQVPGSRAVLGSRRWNWKFREKAGYRNSVTFKL